MPLQTNDRIAVIQRLQTGDDGTFGVLRTPLGFRCLTIELPWRDNRSNISCIPNGEYDVDWTHSLKFGRPMFILQNTAPRSGIRIHVGNLAGDVLLGKKSNFAGCIGLGMKVGMLSGQRAVLVSAPTIVAFENHMERRPFKLLIKSE